MILQDSPSSVHDEQIGGPEGRQSHSMGAAWRATCHSVNRVPESCPDLKCTVCKKINFCCARTLRSGAVCCCSVGLLTNTP